MYSFWIQGMSGAVPRIRLRLSQKIEKNFIGKGACNQMNFYDASRSAFLKEKTE
jgi:hypothetical protein